MSRILIGVFLLLVAVGHANAQARLEAHTPATDTSKVVVGPRIFTAPELDSLKKTGAHVDSLIFYPPYIRITRGESYDLTKLFILALDAEGKRVYRAPLTIEMDAFIASLGANSVMGYSEGKARLRIISLLPRRGKDSSAAADLEVEVTPWPN